MRTAESKDLLLCDERDGSSVELNPCFEPRLPGLALHLPANFDDILIGRGDFFSDLHLATGRVLSLSLAQRRATDQQRLRPLSQRHLVVISSQPRISQPKVGH